MRSTWRVTALLIALHAVPEVSAQTNDEINSAIQFNLSTPGARSLSMGGTFLALADDATAAYTNPAGLTSLLIGGSEAAVEFRAWSFRSQFVSGGRFSGPPSGIGVDTSAELAHSEVERQTRGLSFTSFAHILPGGVVIAGYYHRAANFEGALERQGVFVDELAVFPVRSEISIDLDSTGLAAAYEIPFDPEERQGLSLGLSVAYFECAFSSITHRFSIAPLTGDRETDRQSGGFYGPPDFLFDNLHSRQTQSGDDDGWGFNVGFLWRVDESERWSIGGVYRRMPEFGVDTAFRFGPAAGEDLDGTLVEGLSGLARFRPPSVWGLGIAYQASDDLRIALDYNRVRYSLMARDLRNILLASPGPEGFTISDGDEVHLGGEYLVPLVDSGGLIGTIRSGVWYEFDHRLHYEGADQRLRARFQPGDSELHIAAGFGIVVGESFQVDFGTDLSDRDQTTSLSVVWFF